MAFVERMPSEMADVPKRAGSKKSFFMRHTLVSAQRASKKITAASAWDLVVLTLADGISALHNMRNIFQCRDIVQWVAVHRHKIGKAPRRDAAEFVVLTQ